MVYRYKVLILTRARVIARASKPLPSRRAHTLRAEWAQELAGRYQVPGVPSEFTVAVVPADSARALYEVQP